MLTDQAPNPGNAAVLRRLVERLPAAAVYREGECLWPNRAAETLVGHARDAVATLDAWFSRLDPGRAADARAAYETDRAANFPSPRRLWLVRGDGEERLIEFAASSEGEAEIWLLRDVTEPERLARLMTQTAQAARVGGWEVDCRTGRLFWTEETYRIHELDPSAYHPEVTTAIAFYAPESVPVITEAVRRGRETGECFDLELELITARARRIWVRAIGVTQREKGCTVRLYGSFQDVTSRKLADEALRRSEEQKRQVIAASPDCLLELDLFGQILSSNERGVEALAGKCRELAGRTWLSGWPEGQARDSADEALKEARQGRSARFQAEGAAERYWDVQVVPILDAAGRPDRLLAAARDVTQLKKAEEERQLFDRNLQETQKLESLGVLAGGIAHDFNNLLTGILGNTELVRLTVGGVSGEVAEYLDQIERTSDRAADLCRQMLAYAGKGRFVVEPVELASLVRETVPLLQASISKKAALSVRVPQRLPTVSADATQLNQVLLNLVINASESLDERDGLITVACHVVQVDAAALADACVGADAPEGEYVCLEVSDTGCGMDEPTAARIFEPFYSTKFTGRGLGLAAVLGIVRRHAGALCVESAPGRGTTFRVYLPPTLSARAEAEASGSPLSGGARLSAGGRLVLVVDDEATVRQTAAALCRSLGFDVIEASDGFEALRKLEQTPDVALVLLDWTMPRRDGASTAAQLRRQRPGLPVVVMSGFSETDLAAALAGVGVAGFLKKPFNLEQLAERLREALGS